MATRKYHRKSNKGFSKTRSKRQRGSGGDNDDTDDCMICASPMDANDPENLLVTTTECPKGHTFHKECLHHWCRRTSRTDDQKTLCPYCSTHIPDTCARLRLDSFSGLRRTFALQDGHMSQAEKDYSASKGEVVPEHKGGKRKTRKTRKTRRKTRSKRQRGSGGDKRQLNGNDDEFFKEKREKLKKSINMGRLFGYRNSPERDPKELIQSYQYTDPDGVKALQSQFDRKIKDEGDNMDREADGLTFGGKITTKKSNKGFRNQKKSKKTRKRKTNKRKT